jgi:triacylglycerol lipase
VSILSAALRRPQTYVGHLREALATAHCAALYPFGLVDKALTTGHRSGSAVHDAPVILVHGYGHNRSGWFVLERALCDAGFTSVHTLNYSAFGRDGVPELAERLARRVDDVRRLTGADKVHMVGHSLGGILLRWYVQELGGDRVVDTAITIASPHEGTVTALGWVGNAIRDLRPGSAVVRRLAEGARQTPVSWVAMYSNLDLLVQPAVSAQLRSPALAATNIFVKDHGHVAIMSSPKVTRDVVDRLRRAAVSVPASRVTELAA